MWAAILLVASLLIPLTCALMATIAVMAGSQLRARNDARPYITDFPRGNR